MEEMLITAISKIASKAVKEGIKITSDQLRLQLKDWLLKDEEYEIVSEVINTIPAEYQLNEKIVEAYIETNAILTQILSQAKMGASRQVNQMHTGSGDNIAGDKIINYHK
uniref:hypothetical protein n=1 Tax=Agathobacter sp. TaxID=2021311 RepID=UPI0040563307